MEAEPFVDKLLHLALFVAALGFVGVGAVAVLERVAETAQPVLRRNHLVVAAVVLAALVIAERVYHLVE